MRKVSIISLLLAAASAPGLTPDVDANPVWPGFFELADRPYTLNIPPDGSLWVSLIQNDGMDSTTVIVVEQDVYDDNEDGMVSVGDWVFGPPEGSGRGAIDIAFVSRLYRLVENGWVLKPMSESGGSPVGETWEILLPGYLFGDTHPVTGWTGTGAPAEGDGVQLGGVWYTIQDIRLVIEGGFAVPAETSTWGRIKAWLGTVF